MHPFRRLLLLPPLAAATFAAAPALVIVLITFVAQTLGDWLRDALNPRLRQL